MAGSATWPLAPSTPAGSPSVSGSASGATVSAVAGEYLGRCIRRPFQRDQKNDVANQSGVALVIAAIGQILATKADTARSAGELPWRSDFGSAMELLRHSNVDTSFEALARIYVVDAIQRWEPRAIVRGVSVKEADVDDVAIAVITVYFAVLAVPTPGAEILADGLSVSIAV